MIILAFFQKQSYFFIILVVVSPIVGYVIDKIGSNILWIASAILLAITGHVMLLVTFLNTFIPITIIGVASSTMASALWPMVSLTVSHDKVSTAFGLYVNSLFYSFMTFCKIF